MTPKTNNNEKIFVSWDIADGGSDWIVLFWRQKKDGTKELIQQLDKNSDAGGMFELPPKAAFYTENKELIDKGKGEMTPLTANRYSRSHIQKRMNNMNNLNCKYQQYHQGTAVCLCNCHNLDSTAMDCFIVNEYCSDNPECRKEAEERRIKINNMTPNDEWKRELRKIGNDFFHSHQIAGLSLEIWNKEIAPLFQEIEDSISSLLSSERQRLREEIEKMKITDEGRIEAGMDSYNQALSDILKLLE